MTIIIIIIIINYYYYSPFELFYFVLLTAGFGIIQ